MLKELNQLILGARKGGDKFKTKVLSLVKAELINNSKSKKPMKDMQVVQAYAKRLEKACHAFKNTDRYDDLKKEIIIVGELIPKSMSREEALKIVEEYFTSIGHEDAENVKPGMAIKYLKDKYGAHNGGVLVPLIMSRLKK